MVHSAIGAKHVQVYHGVRPLEFFFSMYIFNDLFFMVTDTAICNFADDKTIFAADSCLDKVLESGFLNNFMKLNKGECHLTFGTIQSTVQIKFGKKQNPLFKKSPKKNY